MNTDFYFWVFPPILSSAQPRGTCSTYSGHAVDPFQSLHYNPSLEIPSQVAKANERIHSDSVTEEGGREHASTFFVL